MLIIFSFQELTELGEQAVLTEEREMKELKSNKDVTDVEKVRALLEELLKDGAR